MHLFSPGIARSFGGQSISALFRYAHVSVHELLPCVQNMHPSFCRGPSFLGSGGVVQHELEPPLDV